MTHIFNIQFRKVGGLHFLFVGRLTFMFCVSRQRNVMTRYDGSRDYAHSIEG
jgi:hypothetical protein